MVVCIIAFVVLLVLSIFSAKYRPLAREAFSCVFRKLTLRKCESGLDQRLKASVSMRILEKHERLGRFVFKYFELIAWVLFIATIISLLFFSMGLYNYALYGNCNGPEAKPYTFCPFDPTSYHGEINGVPVVGNSPFLGTETAKVKVIEFGCFSCPYTKEAEPFVMQLLSEYNGRIQFAYKRFPLPAHAYSTDAAIASVCAEKQDAFWDIAPVLFTRQALWRKSGASEFPKYAQELGLDMNAYNSCAASEESLAQVEKEKKEGLAIGIYGTPTFFVNDKYVVAPQSYQELKALVDEALGKS